MNRPFFSGLGHGVIAAMPVAAGYIPVAIAFGLLARGVSLHWQETAAMSLLVFAGASQFMALDLFSSGTPALQIVLSTLLVNLRHVLMSASLSGRVQSISRPIRAVLAFGVTDESFSVASSVLRVDEKSPSSPAESLWKTGFLTGLEATAYLAWVAGGVAGFFGGGLLPGALSDAMVLGLYALFTALLMPRLRKDLLLVVPAVTAGGFNSLFRIVLGVATGWSFVLSMILASILAVFLLPDPEQGAEPDTGAGANSGAAPDSRRDGSS
ncbi:MAG: AzlC family ABC transporter permease [Spirochaetales bacterium]|nr:AzlC family ABC transporter permease [Spirochaetales bacterium]MCF7939353.1 AzlC family ABC transporter permease [Spirochaetales bacterium]